MSSQRSNTRTRIRGPALENIIADDHHRKDFATPEKRLSAFGSLLGCTDASHGGKRYLTWDVPLLHEDESSSLDFNKVFKNPVLPKVPTGLRLDGC